MPSATSSSLPCCCYLIPNFHLDFQHTNHNRKFTTLSLPSAANKTLVGSLCILSLPQTNNCSNWFDRVRFNFNSSQNHNHSFFLQFVPSIRTDIQSRQTQNKKQRQGEKHKEFKDSKRRVLFTNMWWADFKAALGQRINFEAILCTAVVVVKDPKLALPHISVPDIRFIDWVQLQRKGFKGVVFDKDNTITAPYTLNPWPPLGASLEQCKSVFGRDIAVFSNSAGLQEYDHDGSKAHMLEDAIGIKVIGHRVKKPAGTAEEIEKHFGCESYELIMVGDRPFTDVVYGNRNGFLTILTEPLSLAQEPFIVQQVRKLENSFVSYWRRRGLKPTGHKLLTDPMLMLCVKEPPRS